METRTLLIHKCPHCKSTYKNQEFLMKHIESHTKKIFSCIICGINYNCRKSYNRHISIKHTDNKIECNNCGSILKKRTFVETFVRKYTNKNEKFFV